MRNEHNKATNKKRVLLLNADGAVLTIVSLKRAVHLFMSNKAAVLKFVDGSPELHPALGITMPSVMSLRRYRVMPPRKVTLTRRRIFLRDNHHCQYCGAGVSDNTATIDHVIPRSHKNFPGNVWANMVTACKKCNNRKSDRTPKQADMRLLSHPRRPRWEHLFVAHNKSWKEFVHA